MRPHLSAVLSGTSRQIRNLITDTENCLFSRFVFYRLPTRITWHNVFATSGNGNINEYYADLGAEFIDFYTELKNPRTSSSRPSRASKTSSMPSMRNSNLSPSGDESAALALSPSASL